MRAMEDVLEVYHRSYDGDEALVCMDETSKQQVKETRVPHPATPGAVSAYDYEYERDGVSSLFMLFAPLEGWRRVEVRERRTRVDWAHVIKRLLVSVWSVALRTGTFCVGRWKRRRDAATVMPCK